MMGEKGVEALEKAREQYDNDVEFIARIDGKHGSGKLHGVPQGFNCKSLPCNVSSDRRKEDD